MHPWPWPIHGDGPDASLATLRTRCLRRTPVAQPGPSLSVQVHQCLRRIPPNGFHAFMTCSCLSVFFFSRGNEMWFAPPVFCRRPLAGCSALCESRITAACHPLSFGGVVDDPEGGTQAFHRPSTIACHRVPSRWMAWVGAPTRLARYKSRIILAENQESFLQKIKNHSCKNHSCKKNSEFLQESQEFLQESQEFLQESQDFSCARAVFSIGKKPPGSVFQAKTIQQRARPFFSIVAVLLCFVFFP